MTQLILVRHGETEWNLERRMQGHQDSPLTATGMRQARMLAHHLAQTKIDAIYSSDSGRARETARCVAEVLGLEVIVDSGLRERNFGVFEGLTGREIEARYPEDFVIFRRRDPNYRVPGGESMVEFQDRALACLREIAARHAEGTIVVVTHGLVLDLVYRAAHGIALMEPRTFELVNAGINRVRFAGDTWHVDTWGERGHLDVEVLTSQ